MNKWSWTFWSWHKIHIENVKLFDGPFFNLSNLFLKSISTFGMHVILQQWAQQHTTEHICFVRVDSLFKFTSPELQFYKTTFIPLFPSSHQSWKVLGLLSVSSHKTYPNLVTLLGIFLGLLYMLPEKGWPEICKPCTYLDLYNSITVVLILLVYSFPNKS